MAVTAQEQLAQILIQNESIFKDQAIEFIEEYYTNQFLPSVGETRILKNYSKWRNLYYYRNGTKVFLKTVTDDYDFLYQSPLFEFEDSWDYETLINETHTSKYKKWDIDTILPRRSKLIIKSVQDYYLVSDSTVEETWIEITGISCEQEKTESIRILEPILYQTDTIWDYIKEIRHFMPDSSCELFVSDTNFTRDTIRIGTWNTWRKERDYFIRASNKGTSCPDIENDKDSIIATDPMIINFVTNTADMERDRTYEYGVMFNFGITSTKFQGISAYPKNRFIFILNDSKIETYILPQVIRPEDSINGEPTKVGIDIYSIDRDSTQSAFTAGCSMVLRFYPIENVLYKIIHVLPDGSIQSVIRNGSTITEETFSTASGDYSAEEYIPITFQTEGNHIIRTEWPDEFDSYRTHSFQIVVPIRSGNRINSQELDLDNPQGIDFTWDGKLLVRDGDTVKMFRPYYNICYLDNENDTLYVPSWEDLYGDVK